MMHMMIDLETLGTKPGCVVLSIGAVMFDPFARPNDLGGVANFPHALLKAASPIPTQLPGAPPPQIYTPTTAPPMAPPHTFYREIDIMSSLCAGLIIEPATLEFWKKQIAEKPIGDFFPTAKISLLNAMSEFHMWVKNIKPEKVWAKSPEFDCNIWEHICGLFNTDAPWSFRDRLDVRTAEFMGQLDPKTIPRTGTHHNALDDARFQAMCIQTAMKVG